MLSFTFFIFARRQCRVSFLFVVDSLWIRNWNWMLFYRRSRRRRHLRQMMDASVHALHSFQFLCIHFIIFRLSFWVVCKIEKTNSEIHLTEKRTDKVLPKIKLRSHWIYRDSIFVSDAQAKGEIKPSKDERINMKMRNKSNRRRIGNFLVSAWMWSARARVFNLVLVNCRLSHLSDWLKGT